MMRVASRVKGCRKYKCPGLSLESQAEKGGNNWRKLTLMQGFLMARAVGKKRKNPIMNTR